MNPQLTYEKLNSLLIRTGKNKYQWRDGQEASQVEDLTLNNLAPSFRVVNNKVEIPFNWERTMHYFRDLEVIETVRGLISQHGKRRIIMAERGGHRMRIGKVSLSMPVMAEGKEIGEIKEPYTMYSFTKYTNGWVIPIEEWDHVMSRVVGIKWTVPDEEMIELVKCHEGGK